VSRVNPSDLAECRILSAKRWLLAMFVATLLFAAGCAREEIPWALNRDNWVEATVVVLLFAAARLFPLLFILPSLVLNWRRWPLADLIGGGAAFLLGASALWMGSLRWQAYRENPPFDLWEKLPMWWCLFLVLLAAVACWKSLAAQGDRSLLPERKDLP
jgi:hypothetical protein